MMKSVPSLCLTSILRRMNSDIPNMCMCVCVCVCAHMMKSVPSLCLRHRNGEHSEPVYVCAYVCDIPNLCMCVCMYVTFRTCVCMWVCT
jgi:hypothetical protein